MAEQSAVNRPVVGSSPIARAIKWTVVRAVRRWSAKPFRWVRLPHGSPIHYKFFKKKFLTLKNKWYI